jgi:HEPN domain-containing protein
MRRRARAAREWFEFGRRDLEAARALIGVGGPMSPAGMLLQQATEKYLKGYLIYHGWKLKKTHDLTRLVADLANYDRSFEPYLDTLQRISEYYLEERYPPLPSVSPGVAEMEASLHVIEQLTQHIERNVGPA